MEIRPSTIAKNIPYCSMDREVRRTEMVLTLGGKSHNNKMPLGQAVRASE